MTVREQTSDYRLREPTLVDAIAQIARHKRLIQPFAFNKYKGQREITEGYRKDGILKQGNNYLRW